MKIPEGWPTEEMINAAGTALLEIEGSQKSGNREFQTIGASVSHIVKAALAAAPTPPAQEDPYYPDGCDHEGFPGGCERFGHTVDTCPQRVGPYAHTMIGDRTGWTYNANTKKWESISIPRLPAKEVERFHETDAFNNWAASENYLSLDTKTYAARQGWNAALRYARPQSDELRKAADEALGLLAALQGDDNDYWATAIDGVSNNLRAALEGKS